MMNRKKRKRLRIESDGVSAPVGLDQIESWDGADLALWREVLTEMIDKEAYRSIGVDLQSVKYIPSGFFGMLFEWYEEGISIRLNPTLSRCCGSECSFGREPGERFF